MADLLPPELALDAPPLTDDDLAEYGAIMAMGPNSELRPDGTADPELSRAVERAAHVAGWQPDSLAAAQWCAAKLAEAEHALVEPTQLAQDMHQKIDRWLAQATRDHRRLADLMRSKLEQFAVERRKATGVATCTVPSAVLRTSEVKAQPTVADDETVAAYIDQVLNPPRGDDDAEVQAWPQRLEVWIAAMEEAGLDLRDLVKRPAKVYLQPLRQVVRAEQVVDGYRVHIGLGCGHVLDMPCAGLDDPNVPPLGAPWPCQQCPVDPIDGAPEVPTVEVEVRPITRWAVLGPDGQELPGTAVSEPGLNVSVKVTDHG